MHHSCRSGVHFDSTPYPYYINSMVYGSDLHPTCFTNASSIGNKTSFMFSSPSPSLLPPLHFGFFFDLRSQSQTLPPSFISSHNLLVMGFNSITPSIDLVSVLSMLAPLLSLLAFVCSLYLSHQKVIFSNPPLPLSSCMWPLQLCHP